MSSLQMPRNNLEIAACVVFTVLTMGNFANEAYSAPTPYSKFSGRESGKQAHVSGRLGMLIIYSPSLLASTLQLHPLNNQVAVLLATHFGKRCLEVLFLHKYSSTMPLVTSIFIGSYYTIVSLILANVRCQHPSNALSLLGLVLFSLGECGNLYHHWLLSLLRSDLPSEDKQKSSYKIPKGGLFSYVTMPHYLFELIAWFGVALTSQHAIAFLIFSAMFSYLSGRSVATSRWNREHIANFPANRRNLIPFIF